MSEEKKSFTFLQRLENFWYYNKLWVILGIFFVLACILVCQVFVEPTDDNIYDLTIESVFSHPMTTEEYDLDKRLQESIQDVNNDGKDDIKSNFFYITEERKNDNDYISQGQFETEMKNAKGDLLIFDEPNLNIYLKKDIFAPIEDYIDLSHIPEENIIYRGDIPVAVKLAESKLLSDMKFITDEVYAGVVFTPDNADETTLKSRNNAKIAIEKLLEK